MIIDTSFSSLSPEQGGSGPDEDGEHEEYNEDEDAEGSDDASHASNRRSRSGRRVAPTYKEEEDDDEDDDVAPRRRRPVAKAMDGFVVDDEDDDGDAAFGSSRRRTSSRLKRADQKVKHLAEKRQKKQRRRSQLSSDYEDNGDASMSDDDDDEEEGDPEEEEDSDEAGPRSYSLRRRTKKVDYRLVPPQEPLRDGFGKKIRSRQRSGQGNTPSYELDGMENLPRVSGGALQPGSKARQNWNGLPLSMSGKDYDKFFGIENDDSSDDDIPNSRKAGAAPPNLLGGSASGGLLGAGGVSGGAGSGLGPDLGAGRDAVGRMKGTTELADVDPLGVNMQIDFNSVGGLDNHIQQLKEMVSLPLLYPEVFQRFKVTPPRGVLFHGPPGTGKTLVARALAASCSSSGQQISFFMRKGADCLSKWVGEAERQLRLLFEEAKNAQPSIIFFDEIDGLAPVRSSKQDQIHASIVSTLLALMDGMDGRGQVVVIGATNRPDSVDPALRRPGRFDREFYFPLPNREARKSIININTKEWDPPLDDTFKDKLAEVTKGYGGADLRALCTEAALNAIQRRYPQIYQTTERLQLQPESIHVDARDFMMSVNKVVPSSARSSGSAAAPLKEHLKPLLEQTVHKSTNALDRVMPPTSKRNPLEEAQWEDDAPTLTTDGGFGRELLLQSFEQLRVFRPRLILHGRKGMGQRYVGSALLHHLEGFHVQTLDPGTLLGDSSTTLEAAVVQMFNEAKRHKPSVLYIPNLAQWADTVTESARATFKALLDGLSASDPILLVSVCEGLFEHLPRDIRSWFGFTKENRVQIEIPDVHKRRGYFEELLQYAIKPPSEFPDGMPRKRRVLEDLPIAPPREPRKPTVAELRQQQADDARLLEHLKFRLGPVLAELKKKFPRFKRDVWQEYNLYDLTHQFEWRKEKNRIIVTLLYEPDSQLLQRLQAQAEADGDANGYRNGASGSRGVSVDPSHREVAPAPAVPAQEMESISTSVATNGFGQHPVQEQAQAQAQLMVDPNTPAVANNASEAVDPVALGGLAAAMTGDFSSSNPPVVSTIPAGLENFRRDESGFFVRDLPIWTVNLEKMQKRLYYNGYLTVEDFIEDLGRIVSNAEEAQEVDEERLTRAQQLRNLAVILIDSHIDAEFRASCERMAARMLQREEEAKREAEKEKKEKEEAAKMPKGERHSSRLHGEAPQVSSLAELAALERKRSRPSDEIMHDANNATSSSQTLDEDARKKAKIDEGAMNGSDTNMLVPDAALAAGQLSGVDWNQSTSQSHHQGPVISSLPAHMNGYPNSSSSSQETVLSGHAVAAAAQLNHAHYIPAPAGSNESVLSPIVKAVATPPSANTPHPPLSYDESKLQALQKELLESTSTFTVEQLEQLRASLFSIIWNRRSEWEKNASLTELLKTVKEISEEVNAFNDEEREQDLQENEARFV